MKNLHQKSEPNFWCQQLFIVPVSGTCDMDLSPSQTSRYASNVIW